MLGRSAGEGVQVSGAPRWLADVLAGTLAPGGVPGEVTVHVQLDASRARLPLPGARLVARGVWRSGDGEPAALVEDACSAGFDLLVRPAPDDDGPLRITARYRPGLRTLAANRALRSRFRLLAGQTLVQYPVLWRSGLRGAVPLHAGALVEAPAPGEAAGGRRWSGGVLLIGPGGVGKSTLLLAELAAGGEATCDNLCAWRDGAAYGVVEPLRIEGGTGRRTSRGRREQPLPHAVPAVRPDRLVLLRRDPAGRAATRTLTPAAAAHALTAGTYAAGELRRYWQFAAVLALATGAGPAHPPVAAAAARIAASLPCTEVHLARGRRLADAAPHLEEVS
jgi:hypothetical protein